MSTLDRLAAAQGSTKRDVAAMTTAIAERGADAPVRAVFREDRYGLFEYAGTVATVSDGSRLLAARAFDSGTGKPTTPLRAFEALEALDDLDGDAVDAVDLAHGDLASARIEHSLYGQFDVTGVALQTLDGGRTLIGEWIVADAGKPAPNVTEVRRIASAGEHDIAVPSQLAHVETDVV
ncbi:hypothetical protein [Agrococcus sp. SGAir0287]|uniref:hypothetical protein n=1 Tax=Agrococcus sp. SGAir0287 TaxID=2070347 RepID=UPI0010CCDD89|nr:hypothetical protein [Agrococcus sp. SGAir0287]QCR20284.1 hypothetical protein C1N71_13255 [Agrococcus sp. SGAir0287]